jgi:hypothetical protein
MNNQPLIESIDKEIQSTKCDEIQWCREDGRVDLITEDGFDFMDVEPQTREENLIWAHGYVAGLERAKSMLSK